MRLLALLGVLLAVTAPGWHTWTGRGVSVLVPPGWHATSARLTPVTWPVQFLAVASYPLPDGDRGADGCEPKAAVDRLPANGVFLFGWEYVGTPEGPIRNADFPRRPAHFRLVHPGHYECLDHSYLIRFREAGRYFQLHVLLGQHVGSHMRALAVRVLDSLVVRRR